MKTYFMLRNGRCFVKCFLQKKTIASYIDKPLYYHRQHDMSITTNLYGDSNIEIKENSNYEAFVNVYNTLKKNKEAKSLSGQVFNRFLTFALHQKNDSFLKQIKKDIKEGLLQNKLKEKTILLLLKLPINKYIVKLIHRISRC